LGIGFLIAGSGAFATSIHQSDRPVEIENLPPVPFELLPSAEIREGVDSLWAVPLMFQQGLNDDAIAYPEE
jgi:hypothetical protein